MQFVVTVPLRNSGQHETVKRIHWTLTGHCILYLLCSHPVHVKYTLRFLLTWSSKLLTFIFRVQQFKKVQEKRELFLSCLTVKMKVLWVISGFHCKVDENTLFWVITQWILVVSYWCPIFRGQESQMGDGTDRFTQNVGKKLHYSLHNNPKEHSSYEGVMMLWNADN